MPHGPGPHEQVNRGPGRKSKFLTSSPEPIYICYRVLSLGTLLGASSGHGRIRHHRFWKFKRAGTISEPAKKSWGLRPPTFLSGFGSRPGPFRLTCKIDGSYEHTSTRVPQESRRQEKTQLPTQNSRCARRADVQRDLVREHLVKEMLVQVHLAELLVPPLARCPGELHQNP